MTIPILYEGSEDFSITGFTPSYIQIHAAGMGGEEVAKLYVEDGILHFEGEIDRAAESFFNYLKPLVEDYIRSEVERRLK